MLLLFLFRKKILKDLERSYVRDNLPEACMNGYFVDFFYNLYPDFTTDIVSHRYRERAFYLALCPLLTVIV